VSSYVRILIVGLVFAAPPIYANLFEECLRGLLGLGRRNRLLPEEPPRRLSGLLNSDAILGTPVGYPTKETRKLFWVAKAMKYVADDKVPAEKKAAVFEELAKAIHDKVEKMNANEPGASTTLWMATRFDFPSGETVFVGPIGHALFISPKGKVFKGQIALAPPYPIPPDWRPPSLSDNVNDSGRIRNLFEVDPNYSGGVLSLDGFNPDVSN